MPSGKLLNCADLSASASRRPAEEMTRIVPNICGVCPSAHHMAATKALDDLYSVEPTPAARLIRELEFNAFYIEDHYIHFFFLAAPDFVVGLDADPKQRNILGVIGKVGNEIGLKVIEVRKIKPGYHPAYFHKSAAPGRRTPRRRTAGIYRAGPQMGERYRHILSDFAKFAIQLFKDVVLANKAYVDLILNDAYKLKTYYMSLVDEKDQVSFYDGTVKVIDPEGKEFVRFAPRDYDQHIGEWVEPWTYIRLNHLRQLGWQGLKEGEGTSLYRVAPLARLNVANAMQTPLAQKEAEIMFDTLGGKPAHHTLAYHWARLICALQAAENNVIIADEPQLTSKDIRNMNLKLRNKGVGCVEAPRGTLFHHYETDDNGILTKVNLIVATQNNAAPICLSVKKAAREFVHGPDVKEGFLNMVEMAFRAYDPCLSCATHSLPGTMHMNVRIRNHEGKVIREISR